MVKHLKLHKKSNERYGSIKTAEHENDLDAFDLIVADYLKFPLNDSPTINQMLVRLHIYPWTVENWLHKSSNYAPYLKILKEATFLIEAKLEWQSINMCQRFNAINTYGMRAFKWKNIQAVEIQDSGEITIKAVLLNQQKVFNDKLKR